jgi:hypothetical protein
VIEARHLTPRPRVMAYLAGLLDRRHITIVRLTDVGPVRIRVTTRATEVGEPIDRGVA